MNMKIIVLLKNYGHILKVFRGAMLLLLMRIVANTISGNVLGLKYCSSGNKVAEMAIGMKFSLNTEQKT